MTTLAEIERSAARRVGPFYTALLDRQAPTTAGLETVLVPSLRSSIEQDLVTNLWLLRRGLDWQGNDIAVPDADRQRLVANVEPDRGAVSVERPWQVAPVPGEVIEFHHLDPTLELREAVRAGLRRCLFEDRFNLGGGYIYEADLTAALPWLDDMNMIKRVQTPSCSVNFPGAGMGPTDVPYAVFGECGHVWLRVTGLSYFGGVLMTVHRSHFSWVNGADASDGPREDDDTLNVDLDYAAAAAHIEAWHMFPAKLQAAAAGSLQATREQAAYEYTRQSYVHRLPRHDRQHFDRLVGYGRSVVVNA